MINILLHRKIQNYSYPLSKFFRNKSYTNPGIRVLLPSLVKPKTLSYGKPGPHTDVRGRKVDQRTPNFEYTSRKVDKSTRFPVLHRYEPLSGVFQCDVHEREKGGCVSRARKRT